MSITKLYTALSLEEAYFIDRLNPIHTGVYTSNTVTIKHCSTTYICGERR
jgi:hypothetical protein